MCSSPVRTSLNWPAADANAHWGSELKYHFGGVFFGKIHHAVQESLD